ncbi:MAG: hypothetical protein EOP85_13815, partial [Verrucomicrobiaceae bacterium]
MVTPVTRRTTDAATDRPLPVTRSFRDARLTGVPIFFGMNPGFRASDRNILNHMHRFFLFFLLSFSCAALSHGQKSGSSEAIASVAELIPENTTIAPGATFTLALKLEHPAEWHSYYQNSGGVELPPSIAWKLPEGFTAGAIQWPVPEVKEGYFGKSFIYSGSPAFLIDVTAPDTIKAGSTVSIGADASWQICKESCISEDKSFTLTLQVGDKEEKDPAQASLFDKARKSQPAKVMGLQTEAHSEGADITLRVEAANVVKETPADFVPDQTFVLPASAGGSITKDGDTWVVTLKRATKD